MKTDQQPTLTFADAERRWKDLNEKLQKSGPNSEHAAEIHAELCRVLEWIITTPPRSIGDIAVKLVAISDPALIDVADDEHDGDALRQCFEALTREFPGADPRLRELMRQWSEHDEAAAAADSRWSEDDDARAGAELEQAEARRAAVEDEIIDLQSPSLECAIVKLMLSGAFHLQPFGEMDAQGRFIVSALTDLARLAARDAAKTLCEPAE